VNPVFREQVDALFQKLAWPFDLDEVARQAPDVAGQIRAGRGLFAAGERAVRSAPGVARAGKHLVEGALRPAPGFVAKPILGLARGARDFAAAHPGVARTTVGLALLAPILGSSFHGVQHRNEETLMNLREDPGRDITASLDAFLEKKAAAIHPFLSSMGGGIQTSFAGGVGAGLAHGTLDLLAGAMKGGLGTLKDVFVTDRRRKELVKTLVQNDVVLSDAIARSPNALPVIQEAFETMCRFAPSLSLDANAVRSFLREAVVGGAGVNYATIKNLIETERALHPPTHH
jgi:hypothetical protein